MASTSRSGGGARICCRGEAVGKERQGLDGAVGIDRHHPLPRHLGLEAADGGGQGEDLAVEIGRLHGIEIDQAETTDPGPCQGLDDVAADGAETDDGHKATLQPAEPFLTEEAANPRKSFHWSRSGE